MEMMLGEDSEKAPSADRDGDDDDVLNDICCVFRVLYYGVWCSASASSQRRRTTKRYSVPATKSIMAKNQFSNSQSL